VVGGVAVNVHGYLRATNDLDIFIRPTEKPPLSLRPAEDHIEVLASIGEMSFDQVWRNRLQAEVEGIAVPFISKADLIENKRQTGRLRGLTDVEELNRIPGPSLDVDR
jgi:hypothetical protein